MSKNLRRLTLLLAAVFVMMIMAVPAFATTGNGYKLVSDMQPPAYSENDTIHVTVMVQSRAYSMTDGDVINTAVSVPLTGKTSYTVVDVMRKFNDNNISPNVKACDNDGNLIPQTGTLTTINAFKKIITTESGTVEKIYKYLFFSDHGYGLAPSDGWVFRVNGKFPLLSLTGENNGPQGAYINQTPIADGDIVSFYTNYPWKESNQEWSTTFVAADASYTAPDPEVQNSVGSLSVQLKGSSDWHSNAPFVWTINQFSNFSSFTDSTPTGTLYASDLETIVGTISFDASTGAGTLNQTLNAGTYYLYVPSTQKWRWLVGYTNFSGTDYTYCMCLENTLVFDRIVIG